MNPRLLSGSQKCRPDTEGFYFYYFGNLFYSVFSYMDPKFQYKDPSLAKRFLRLLADPITDLFFQKTKKGIFDRDLNHKLYELFTGRA